MTRAWHKDSLLEVRCLADASVVDQPSLGLLLVSRRQGQLVIARDVQEGGTTQSENENTSCIIIVATN